MSRSLVCAAALLAVLASAARADDWPQFRGPDRTGISRETGLLRKFPEGGPRVVWSLDVCQGYSGAAVVGGRVFFNDYDEAGAAWLVRCVTLDEGKELWRFREEKRIRPNHGITRTVPAVDGTHVYSLDPKNVLHALDARTGAEAWRRNLIDDFGGKIPPWYAGQCPLLEPDRIVVAPGGKALLAAFRKDTGAVLWETPNDRRWPESHSSVMPAELCGVRQYLHAGLKGAAGVSAEDGKELWRFDRKFNIAMVPAPLPLPGDRVFLTNQYKSGSTMIRVRKDGASFAAEELFSLDAAEWNSEVHTPILHAGRLFAVGSKRRGLFTCLDLDGKIVWTSEDATFGNGSFLLADGLFFVLDGNSGLLRIVEATPEGYRELDRAQVLGGDNVWAPLALSEGRLVLRDWTRMVCIEVRP